MIKSKLLVIFNILLLSVACNAQERVNKLVTFDAVDDLKVSASLYLKNSLDSPFIILFHQAGWSKGEYLETAPKLNELGFNCMAVDQRSGKEVNGVTNETHHRAKERKLPTKYENAEVDMIAAIDYVKKNYPSAKKVILLGSSYSSALVLKLAGERKDIDAVLSFSPGEYFGTKDYITKSAKNITVPVFITSAKGEKKNWQNIYLSIPSKKKQYFLPTSGGQHGSRALWKKFPQHEEYWKAVKAFLASLD